jgi:sigma-E factor negative regulatory protein RseA
MSEARPPNDGGDRQGERDSQISAMFDGELSAAECELLARRLAKDEALRGQWSRYSLIGAALRAERGVKLHDRVAVRVQAQISQEVSYGDSTAADSITRSGGGAASVGGGITDRWMRFARPVFGAGIAAGVAAASILWLRAQESPQILASNTIPQTVTLAPEAAGAAAVNTMPVAVIERVVSNGEPERYTTPVPSSSTSIAPPARLANYVVAHSEYSSPLTRRMALLGLVAGDGPSVPAEDAAPAAAQGTPSNAH